MAHSTSHLTHWTVIPDPEASGGIYVNGEGLALVEILPFCGIRGDERLLATWRLTKSETYEAATIILHFYRR